MSTMLSDWEEEQLAEMELDLRADKALERVLRAPSPFERRWLAVKAQFYPVGFLLCAMTYMVLAGGASQVTILVGAGLTGLAAWVVIELGTDDPWRPLARALLGLD